METQNETTEVKPEIASVPKETDEEILVKYSHIENMSEKDLSNFLESMSSEDRKILYRAAANIAQKKNDEFSKKFKLLVAEYDIVYIGSFAQKTLVGPMVTNQSNIHPKHGSNSYKILLCAEQYLNRLKERVI